MSFFIDLMQNYAFQTILSSAGILGAAIGITGGLLTLKKNALSSQYVPNGAFIGVLVSYIIAGSNAYSISFLFAFIFALVAFLLVSFCKKTPLIDYKINESLLSASLFGAAMLLLTYMYRNGANAENIKRFIFGASSTLLKSETDIIVYTSLACMLVILLGFKRIKIIMFDKDFALNIGIPVAFYNIIISLIFILLVVSGIQIMGILLITVLFVAPSLAARQFTQKFTVYMLLSGIFGFLIAFIGAYSANKIENITTGTSITIISFLVVSIALIYSMRGKFFNRAGDR